MTIARNLSIVVAVGLALAAVASLTVGGDKPRPAPAHAAKFTSRLTPLQTERHGISNYAYYSADPKAMLPSPRAQRQVRKVSARVAAAEQAATFSVLGEPQTSAEASDPILAIVAKDRPELDIARARALDATRKYWLLPTSDGQVCLGQKTSGVRIFALTCGYDQTVAETGLAQRLGDDLTALVPDGARQGRAADGDALRISRNLLVAGQAGRASFELAGKTHWVG